MPARQHHLPFGESLVPLLWLPVSPIIQYPDMLFALPPIYPWMCCCNVLSSMVSAILNLMHSQALRDVLFASISGDATSMPRHQIPSFITLTKDA